MSKFIQTTKIKFPRLLECFIPNYNNFYVFSQDKEYDCGPAVALSIINYLNGNVTQTLNDLVKAMKTDKITGTSTENMVKYFKSQGFKVASVLDKGYPKDYNSFIILIKEYLYNGIPVIVENHYINGHWRIIIGYDENNETLIITDSYSKINNIQVINARDFYSNWYDFYMKKGYQIKQWIAVYK